MKNKNFKWYNTRYKILRIILIVTLVFIWGQSLIPKSYSQVESDTILAAITSFYDIDLGNVNPDEYWVYSNMIRKFAHIIEYTILGTEMICYIFFRVTIKKCAVSVSDIDNSSCAAYDNSTTFMISVALIGMLVGLVDETLQIFSHRGSMILDVWIDSFSVVIGIILGSKITKKYNRKLGHKLEKKTIHKLQ